ncbi:MAG TPA: WYL domain-containing protein [Candidatus Merdisoma merdipullorum]|nr:WYL domain-containing protein [Candidatus Merdisoma merdipullorum]
MNPKTKSESEIPSLFEEIYGSYFQAVRMVLTAAHKTPLTVQEMEEIVHASAFEESALSILPRLTKGPWSSLLKKEGENTWKSALKTASLKAPLSSLQKSWLKSLLPDSRFRLFFTEEQLARLEEDLKEVPPLYDFSDFHYFDRYTDGDPYENPEYRGIFQTIIKSITEKKALYIAYEGAKGKHLTLEVVPCRLQYSPKDDKFRLLSVSLRHGKTGVPTILNLGRMKACHISKHSAPGRFDWNAPGFQKHAREPVRIRIANERNALERCMLHFSSYEKQTVYEAASDTWLCSIFYDPADETELLIELLSFGPVIRILSPESILTQVRLRVQRQHELFSAFATDKRNFSKTDC